MVSSHGFTAPMTFTRWVRGYSPATHWVETINLRIAMDSSKGHTSVVDSELSCMFRAHPLGEFEKRNRMGRMKPSNVPVNSIFPILPILLTPPEVYGSLRCIGSEHVDALPGSDPPKRSTLTGSVRVRWTRGQAADSLHVDDLIQLVAEFVRVVVANAWRSEIDRASTFQFLGIASPLNATWSCGFIGTDRVIGDQGKFP